MKNRVLRFLADDTGLSAVEYGLIAALVAVGIIAAAKTLGGQISTTFTTAKTTMKNA